MGQREDRIRWSTIARLENLDDNVKKFLNKIIDSVYRSNATKGQTRKVYRLVREMADLKILQKYTEAENAIALLKKIEFLLPPKVESDLEELKERLKNNAKNMMKSQESGLKDYKEEKDEF